MWRRSRRRRGRRARCIPSTRRDGNTSKSSGGPGASSRNDWNSFTKEASEMAPKWIELVTGSLEQKKQYKRDRARIAALPEPYRAVAKALQRYFMYSAGILDQETAGRMFTDFVDLWERAAADGTPVRAIVGENPAEFAETFVQAYAGKQWIDKERARLTKAIEDAERGKQK